MISEDGARIPDSQKCRSDRRTGEQLLPPSPAFMSGICPEALCLLVPSGLGEAQLELLRRVVILDPAHLDAWLMASETLEWREPDLSQMWDCMGHSSTWLLWGGPAGGWGRLRSMLHGWEGGDVHWKKYRNILLGL